jgi:hypothetical protein
MFVQRLLRWFAALPARLSSRPVDIPAREVVHAGQTRATVAHDPSYRPSGGLATARWLDDARRLRPVRLRPAGLGERARPTTRPSAGGESRRERESAARPRPTPPLERSMKPAQPSQPVAPAPAAAMPPLPHHSPAERELLALRHLVRLGIYNEGFTNGAAPEQYRHSLGLDDSGDDDLSAQ